MNRQVNFFLTFSSIIMQWATTTSSVALFSMVTKTSYFACACVHLTALHDSLRTVTSHGKSSMVVTTVENSPQEKRKGRLSIVFRVTRYLLDSRVSISLFSRL
jgi:hypothetical protein